MNTININKPEFFIENLPSDVQDFELILKSGFTKFDFSGLNRDINSITIISVSNHIEREDNDFELTGFDEDFETVYDDSVRTKISYGIRSEEFMEVVEQYDVPINGFIIGTITLDMTLIDLVWPQ